MVISSIIERGSPWAGLNAMATAVGVRKRRVPDRFDPDITPTGMLVLAGGLLLWGIAYQGALGTVRRRRPLLAGLLSGLGGYLVDTAVLPDWLMPNFRRKMGPLGTAAKYIAIGAASAACTRKKQLQGRRIAVLATDGFEQVEVTVPLRALRAEGAEAEIISLRDGKIVGMNVDVPGRRVRVDRTLAEADPAHYDGLLIPGGFINPDLLRQSSAARDFVRAFDKAKKPIAVICHGPWLLASAELLAGRRITSWPGIRDDLVHAGGTWLDEPVVRDGNVVSSRGPQDLRAFVRAMIDLFAGEAPRREKLALPPTVSAPQRTTPPPLATAGARLMPRLFQARSALGLAAVVIGGGMVLRALREGGILPQLRME
jgi:protease I